MVRVLHDGADCAQVYGVPCTLSTRPVIHRAGHEYAIPATGTVKYDCCSATGEP